jgi:urease accessory protein
MLHLSFEPAPTGTILRVKAQQPPWRVVRGFPCASGETLAHIHNMSGGVLDNDQLEWRVDVAPAAQAQVTSTGATRIYRSRSADRIPHQHAIVHVGENGYLEYLPDPLIPFSGSRFKQTTRILLDRGASLIWWDRVAPGREASGEIFAYDLLRSSFELIAEGEPIAVETWTLDPKTRPLDSPARLAHFRHFASCYVCRAGEPAPYWRAFETVLQAQADRLSNPDILWGISMLRAHGLVIRGVAVNGRTLAHGLVELWGSAKHYLCGRVATLPRKVN